MSDDSDFTERKARPSKDTKKKDYTRGQWLPEEDTLLLHYTNLYGTRNWSLIASHIPNRIGKQCRSRYYNHLDPSVSHAWFSKEEDKYIIEQQAKIGNKWAVIAHALPGRTRNATLKRLVEKAVVVNGVIQELEVPQCPKNRTTEYTFKPPVILRNIIVDGDAEQEEKTDQKPLERVSVLNLLNSDDVDVKGEPPRFILPPIAVLGDQQFPQ